MPNDELIYELIIEEVSLTVQEGLCGDEEGSSAHSQQGDELQKPEPVGQHQGQERFSVRAKSRFFILV